MKRTLSLHAGEQGCASMSSRRLCGHIFRPIVATTIWRAGCDLRLRGKRLTPTVGGLAQVELVSNARGEFQFVHLPPAVHRLEARLDGFTPFVETVVVAAHGARTAHNKEQQSS